MEKLQKVSKPVLGQIPLEIELKTPFLFIFSLIQLSAHPPLSPRPKSGQGPSLTRAASSLPRWAVAQLTQEAKPTPPTSLSATARLDPHVSGLRLTAGPTRQLHPLHPPPQSARPRRSPRDRAPFAPIPASSATHTTKLLSRIQPGSPSPRSILDPPIPRRRVRAAMDGMPLSSRLIPSPPLSAL